MRLIVGLGNPGPQYAWTPHNLGFFVIDRLAEKAGLRIERPEAKAYIARAQLCGQEVVLAKPQTSMNLSGLSVRELVQRFDVDLEADPAGLIVIYDEAALPWGMIRIRERGSAGGHNGVKSIIGALGTDEFARIRLGVKPEYPVDDLAGYVLAPMRKAQLEVAAEMVEQASEAAEVILTDGLARAMNRYNKRVPPPDEVAGQER